LAGCSDPKAATKSNFKKVAEAYYQDQANQKLCFKLPDNDELLLGFFGSVPEDRGAIVASTDHTTYKELESLTKHALLTRETRALQESKMFGKSPVSYRYKLTEKSKPYLGGSEGTLCYAKLKLLSVKEFTAPAQLFGKTISEVTLVLRYDDVADWMQDKDIQANFLRKVIDLKAPKELKKTFILMNDGWQIDKVW